MKKLLLVALLVAVPALVLAQATTTTPAKTEVKKVETAATTKATEAAKPAATEVKTAMQPESILIGEIIDIDNTNKIFSLKIKDKGNVEKISFKSTDPLLKKNIKIKVIAVKEGDKWTVKKLEEHRY